jgi:hypothetical protein
MGAPGYFVAAGLFMIAAAVFTGHAMANDRNAWPAIASFVCVLTTVFLLGNGAAVFIRERKKDQA